MEWISVDDRLPEEDEVTLLLGKPYKSKPCGVFLGFLSNGRLQFAEKTFGWVFMDDCPTEDFMDELENNSEVTHWMPLPEPPK